MKRHDLPTIVTALGLLALLFSLSTAATAQSYPPDANLEEVRNRIDAVEPAHPGLLADQQTLESLARYDDFEPFRRELAIHLIEQADVMLEMEPVERRLQGRRLLGESRRCIKRTLTLATAYYLTGEEKYAQRCEEEMLAAANFSDWNPDHFLDVAEMTFALAIGYDWLFEKLSESSRRIIREAIVNKSLRLPFETEHNRWVRATNNWGQVCHGGLTAGALAVREDYPDLAARTVHRAVENVTRSMAAYAPRGSYPEGPGYWAYGTNYNVILLASLESLLESDFGLSQAPGFDRTGAFPALATGPSGLYFNYADGGAARRPEPALYWLAKRFQRPDWLLGERERIRRHLAEKERKDAAGSSDRLLPLILLWSEAPPRDVEIRMPLHWRSGGETPITLHRSSWNDPNATFVGFKAGSPSANHGQMDIGSFVLEADGIRWAIDLGAESYHGIESRGMDLWNRSQDSDRWTIFRQSNAGHNTLVIDGERQRAAGHAEIVAFSDSPQRAFSIAGLSEVYVEQAGSVRRGVALMSSGEVLIQDELTGLRPGAAVRWGMLTSARPEGEGSREVVLHQEGARLIMNLLSPEVQWKVIDTSKPRREWDSPNPGTRMIFFEAIAPDTGELTLRVLATPGSVGKGGPDNLEYEPLEAWAQ